MRDFLQVWSLKEDSWLTVHLLDPDPDRADGDVAVVEQATCCLPLGVHDIAELDVFRAKLLLVLL